MTYSPSSAQSAFERALQETYQMVDPFNPPPAGTYHRGQHEGIIAALKTIRANFDRAAASAHTIGEDAANGAIGEREAHCVNTCNFYNKNRPCECPAPQSDAAAWEAIFDRVAVELNCLPSSSPDGNEHVFHAIAKLRAAPTAAQTNRDYEVENALTDALSALIDKIKPGLDCGNIIEDAKAASDALDESRLYTAPQPVQTERALTNDSRDAARYRWLRETLHGAKAGGGVEVNERRQVYEEPVQEEEVRVYWYQHTPVGFYESQASTLDAAIDDAMTAAQPASSLAEGDKQ